MGHFLLRFLKTLSLLEQNKDFNLSLFFDNAANLCYSTYENKIRQFVTILSINKTTELKSTLSLIIILMCLQIL